MKDHTAAHEFSATSPRVHLSVKNLGIWGMLQLRTEIESHNYFRFKTPQYFCEGARSPSAAPRFVPSAGGSRLRSLEQHALFFNTETHALRDVKPYRVDL